MSNHTENARHGFVGRMLLLSTLVSSVALGWVVLQRPPDVAMAGQGDTQQSPDELDLEHPTVLSNQSRFTGPGEGWPPKPRRISDVQRTELPSLGNDAAVDGAQRRLDDTEAAERQAEAVLLAHPEARAALGDAYVLVAAEQNSGKDSLGGITFVYLATATAETVEGTVVDGSVVELAVHEPEDFQPPISADEAAAAVALATEHWNLSRDARIDRLEGYGILALQDNGRYYDRRVVYVSFHDHLDARPELLTWVDLTNGAVIKAEVDR